MSEQEQYFFLNKPFWAPPDWVFGPVWTVLYIVIAISFGVVFYKAFKREISLSIAAPFALNLIFNLAFTPIQFGLRNLPLASLDIIAVLATLLWGMMLVYKIRELRWVFFANVPYLLWTTFATALQLTITWMNR